MSKKLLDLIFLLVDAGILCDLRKRPEGYYWDLNLQSKSHMYLFEDAAGRFRVDMRYGEQYFIDDIDDLKYYAKQGMHGRDFISTEWVKFMNL